MPDPFTVVVSDDVERVSREGGVALEGLVAESARRVFELLPHRGRISIYVALDASRSIPETGVGGFTDPSTGTVSIWIDDTPPGGLKAALEAWVPATMAHELHHSSRVRTGPGYGSTLAEVLVTEGLADHFVLEAFPDTPPQPWDNALSQAKETDVWRTAQSGLGGS